MTIPTTSQLEHLLNLTKKKEALQADLEKIDQQIAVALAGNEPYGERPVVVEIEEPVAAPKGPRQRHKPRAKRLPAKASAPAPAAGESIKDKVLVVLKEAGKDGLSVGEVAEKIGGKTSNLSVWFSTTGKKVKEIKKVGPGRFGLR